MWRRVAFSMGLSLILFGIVAVVTTGELADAQEMPIKAESSPRTNAVAFQQEVDSYPAATDVPTATNVITFRQDIDGYVGCADTRISAEHPNTNFGDEELVLGMRGQVGTLIRFDVSSIPPFAVIEEAKLGLFCHNYGQRPSDPAEAAICAAYPVSRTWKEMEATWNKAMELDSWGLPGCDDNASDRSPTPLDQQEIYTHTQWYTWNVTSAVQDWVKDHASNKGVYIRQLNTEVGGEYDFRASEYRGLEKRPYLTIKYLLIPPPPDITVSKELTQPPSGIAVLSDTVTFTLRITNIGLTAINSLTVTDTYDGNFLTPTSWSQEPDEQAPGIITWTWNTLDPFLPLAPQQGFAWTLDFLGKAPTDLTTNTITARGVDEYGQAVAQEDHADVQIIPPPDITVSKELTQPPNGVAVLPDTITFTLRITNTGPTIINSLTVTDTYDSNFLTPTSWSQEPDEQAPGIITWTWNTLDPFLPLAPQQGFAWTLDFLGKAPTDLTTNTITARGVDEYGQTVAQEDHADVQIIPPLPDITVSKELTQPSSGVAVLSDTITFTLRITNTGATTINSLTVTDTYDSNLLTPTSWSQEPDQQAPGMITWTWNALDPLLPLAPQQGFAWTLDFLGKAPTDLTTNTITARGVDEYGQAVAPKKDHADVQIISDYYRLYLPKVLKKFPMICVKWGYTFREEFEDPALDGWMVSLNGGQVEVSNGIIHLGTVTNTNTFPLVCRCQLLDDTGEDFAMEARFRHSDFTAYGTTVALNSASYDGSRVPAGQPLPPGIEDILNIHHVVDETEPENDRFDISMLNGRVLWNGTPGDTNWHVVRVTLEQGGWYTLYVDGQCIGSARSSVMPSSIYIGNPTIQSFRERWTQLHVDYIRISRCVEWDP